MFKTHGIPIQILSVYKSASDIAANKPLHVTAAVSDTTRTALSTRVVDLDDPRFVYAVCRAVTADCPNKNGDMFTAAELKRAYPSFVGCNLFLDHKTSSVRDAVGKIVAAEYIDNDKSSEHPYVATLIKIDAVNRPDIAGMVKTGTIDSVSMGANVRESECSICGNRASKKEDFCFTPGTQVATQGFIYKNIEDIVLGEKVVSHKGFDRKVTCLFKHEIDEDVYTIKSAFNNNPVTATGNHPFAVATSTGLVWKRADELQVGDWLYQPNYKYTDTVNPEFNDPDFAEWLGYYISEGWTNHKGQCNGRPFSKLEFSVASYEEPFIKRILELGKKFLGKEGKVYTSYNGSKACSVRFCGDNVGADLYKYGGHHALRKQLSPEVFGWGTQQKLNLLHGYLEGDGSINRCGRSTYFSTSSKSLAYQVKKLSNDIGYPFNVCTYTNGGGPTNRTKSNVGYHISIYGDNSVAFLKKQADCFKPKQSTTFGQYFTWMGDYFFQVLSIEKHPYCGPVYNLAVEEDNSYIVEGVAVHNCSHLQPENLGRQDFNTGKIACSINHGVEFTELSLVSVPADPTAKMHQVFAEAKQNMKVTAAPMEAMQGAPSAMLNPAAPMPAATPDPMGGGAPGQEDNKPVDPNKELQGPLGEEDEIENHDEDVDAEFTTEKDDNGQVLEGYNFICKSNETADAIFNLLSSYKGEGVLNVAHKGLQVNVSFVPGLVPDKENFISQIFKSTKEYKVQFKKPVVDSEGSNNEDEEQSTEENKTVTSAASATDTVMKVTAKNNEKETTMDTRKITAAEEDFNKEDEELEDTAAETEDKAESEAKTAKDDAEEADKEADKAESEAETAKDDAEDAEAEDKKEEAKKDIKEALKNLSPEEVDEILNEVKGEKGAGSADANMGEDGDNSLTPLDVDMTNDNNAAAEQVPGVDEKMGEEPMNPNTPKNPFPGKEDESMNVTGEGEDADMPNTINASAMQAELKTGMDKTASLADSTWVISRKADYGTILSFPIKAAFGADIANDKNRLEYATSQKFGDAVVASLASGNIKSQADAELAILKLAAHYTPSHSSVNQFKTEEKSKHGKNSEKVENKTYKDMGCQEAGKEIKASVKDGVRKVVAACDNGAGKEGDQGNQMEQNVTDKAVPMVADSAQTHPASTNTSPVESGHPKASQKIEDGVYKAMAALEEKIKLQAAEIAEKSRKIANLQARIDFNIKANEVKDVIQLMASKGMIARDESVFNNALSRGLDLKAAHAAAMKAAISAQQKELLQLSSPALQAFASSITKLNVTASQPIAKSAALDKPFKVQASYEAPSEADMMARYEKILDFSKRK